MRTPVVHYSLSDNTRFLEKFVGRWLRTVGNGDLKRTLAELVQMGCAGALENASAAADTQRKATSCLTSVEWDFEKGLRLRN